MEPVSNTLPILGFATRSYDAYGYRDLSIDGARTGFAGEISEAELPWYLLGERFYVPSLRRFISPDAASPFEVGGLNRYAYCSGDPLNRIDPSGEGWFKWVMLGIGLVVSVAALAFSAGSLAGVVGGAWVAASAGATGYVTTSSMVTMVTAVLLDTAAVVAEIGAIVSEATGNEKANAIFGYIALGTSVTRLGMNGSIKVIDKFWKLPKHTMSVVTMFSTVKQSAGFATEIGILVEKEIAELKKQISDRTPEKTTTSSQLMPPGLSEVQGDGGSFAATRYSSSPAEKPGTAVSWTDPLAVSDDLTSPTNGNNNEVREDRPGRNAFPKPQSENPLSNLPREVERSIVWSRTNHFTGRTDDRESNKTISHPKENVV